MANLLPRLDKRILNLYRLLITKYGTSHNPTIGRLLDDHYSVREIIEPLVKNLSPSELDRMILEMHEALRSYTISPFDDVMLFSESSTSPYYSYMGSPYYPPIGRGILRWEINRIDRYTSQYVSIVKLPPLPIRNKKPWVKKWKMDPPYIPL